MKSWIALLAVFCAGVALAEPPTGVQPAVVVTLKFTGERVEVAAKESRDAFVLAEYGMPQLEPLFFEAYGAEGEVVYAGAIPEPAIISVPQFDADEPAGETVQMDEGAINVAIPASAKAQKLKVFRRVSDDPEKVRELLLEAGL